MSLPVNLFRGIELTKVSVYIDDSIWAKFKKEVFYKYGNLRKLSSEVEMLLRSIIIEDAVTSGFEKIGIDVSGTISSREIKATRPQLRGPPSEDLVKRMRQRRVAEALSRQ